MATNGKRHRPFCAGARRLAAAALFTAALAGCGLTTEDLTLGLIKDESEAQSAPDGVYAVQNGKLGRLDEDPQKVVKTWDLRTNLPPNVQFLVVDDSVAAGPPNANAIRLQKVVRVRNDVEANGSTRKVEKAEWVAADLPDYEIPVTVTRKSDAPRVLEVVANRPLGPGLYSLTYETGASRIGGRFGIQWKTADKTQYAAHYCVDRYRGNPAYYRPCSEARSAETAATPAATAGTFKVHDLKVRKNLVGGQPSLLLEGQVTNSSTRPQNAPLLLAVINDKTGKELARWTFRPNLPQIPPGGTLGFSSSANVPPEGAAKLSVTPVAEQVQSAIETQQLDSVSAQPLPQ